MKWLYVLVLSFVPFITGCAGCRNDIAARGGLLGSHEGDYVVVNYSGNVIADVWVLRDVYVQSEENSDGWRFQDVDGNVIFLGGDVKVMRMDKASELDKWHDYHSEFESQTYQQKFCK
jgi:hypothetical protein